MSESRAQLPFLSTILIIISTMSAKRSQPSSPEAEPRSAEEPQRSQPVSLQGFHLLPTELKDQVIRLACLASSSSPSTNPSPSGLDSGTMFKLSLVCRDLNAQVSPLLWRHVSITRPSALYDLVEAIKAQPGKAKDIESLHVGQYDPLPSYWWPLSSVNDEGEWSVWIASSLPRDRLPAGCEDRQSWRWDERPDGRREAAVYDALQVAHRSLRASQIYEGGDVGITVEPIMELQAVLDLYLMELRRLEEASSEPVYPSLVLKDVPLSRPTGPPPAQVEPPGDAFVVPYAELLPHLARRGSLTDRFDHPLILERSSLKVIVRAPPVKSVLPNNVGSRATFTVHQGSDRVFDEQAGSNWFGWAPLQDAAAKDPALEKNPYSLARATATMSSVLDLTRGVLYATTSLRNISLTGYLEQVLRSTSHSSLLRASIGPTALPGWHATVPSHGVKFVQELRLCGKHLGGWEAHQVSVMTRLQRFEYCLWEPFVRRKRGDL